MTDDPSADIDSILASELPDREFDNDKSEMDPKRVQMIQVLQEAAEELGKSPSVGDFDALDTEVSSTTIKQTFGGWDAAKEAAGLEPNSRGRSAYTRINESYFETLDTPAKAYWLGTLIATSSLHKQPNGGNYALRLGRVEDKAYFITEFADAIDSEYAFQWQSSSRSDKEQLQLLISNPTFIELLLDTGYPAPTSEQHEFPAVPDKYRPAFIRGFLESSGYFGSSGWQIRVETFERAEMLHEWFEMFGAKRPSVSQTKDNSVYVRVSNAFDVASIFESLYPDLLDTEPSWTPYPEQIIEYLSEEHPYPENLDYVDT